jgi:uncharacterized membrane protein YhdT
MEILDKKLYEQVKQEASKKFISKSGIYRSAWIVREYKKRGGKYSGKKPTLTGLPRWFKELYSIVECLILYLSLSIVLKIDQENFIKV